MMKTLMVEIGRLSEATKTLIPVSCQPLHPYHILSGESWESGHFTEETLLQMASLAKAQFAYSSFVSQLIDAKIPFGYMTDPASRKIEKLANIPLIQNLSSQPKLVISPTSLGLDRLSTLFSDLYLYLEDQNEGETSTAEPLYVVSAKIRVRSKKIPLGSHMKITNPQWTFHAHTRSFSFRKEGLTDYVSGLSDFLTSTMKLARLAYQCKGTFLDARATPC